METNMNFIAEIELNGLEALDIFDAINLAISYYKNVEIKLERLERLKKEFEELLSMPDQ
jgi:hypothetical protein